MNLWPSPMIRNLIIIITGVLLTFLLSLVGSRLVWLLIIGNVERSENKDAIVRVMLLQTFGVIPVVAIIVGVFVGSLVPRSRWWLGGVTLLPLFIYGLVRGASGVEVLLSVAQLLLAFAAAFVLSRFKRPNPSDRMPNNLLQPSAG